MVGTVTEKMKATEKMLAEYVKDEVSEYDTLPLSETARFAQFSRYPYIVRDIALWCPKGTGAPELLEDIKKHAGSLLVRSELFDTFEKGERISYAFRLVFQSFDQTLTDLDANERMESIYSSLRSKGYEIR
jgi:phenylalanyl-tRNA synthetase beta chain